MHSRHAKSSPHITSHTNAPRSSRSRLRLRSPSSQLLRRESLLSLSSDTQPAHASSSTAAAFLADFPPLRHAAASDFTSRDHHLLHQKREKLKKGKRRGAIDGIRPDRDEKDEDGKWAELAFKEMTLRVDLLAKTTHVTKVKHEDWTIKLQQNYFKVIFHPENVAADDLRTWRVHYRTLRTPASDGLHFPLPDFSLSNLWKLERRLRFGEPDEGTKWFTPDGRLDIRPLSLAQIVYRPTRPVIEIITPSYRRIHPLTLLPSSSSDDADGDMCTVILSPPTPVRPSIRPAAAPTPYLLIFQLLSVEMHDHPLVTEEMRLAKGVEDRVDAWRTRQGRDWDGRVQALRNEYRMVKERYGLDAVLNSRAPPVLDMGSGAQATFVQRVRHLISLLTQLLQTRSQMREEDEMNRLLEFEIVRNWELVKACRNEQGFASCAFRLEVRAALNPASDVNGNDTDTENDQETMEKEELEVLKQILNSSTEQQQQQQQSHISTSPVEQSPSSPKKKSSSSPSKPKPKHKPTSRPHPALSFTIFHDTPITPLPDCPSYEQSRRTAVHRMTVAAKLFVNDREVVTMCGRRSVDHRGTVTVEFGSEGGVVPVYTNERVESIRVDVWENNAFLATTYIPVPSPLRTLSLIDRTPYHLSFSGRPQTTTSYADEWTSGSVEVDVSWGVDNDGNSLGPKTQKNDDAWEKVRSLGLGSEVFGVTGLSTKSVIDVRKWMEWIQDQPIDPLDPRSTRLIQLREVIQRVSSHADIVALKASRKVFRMDIPKWLKAVTLEIAGDIPMDLKRFTLLMRRKERQTAGEAPVPLLEQEVDERMMKLSVQRPQEEEHPIPLIRQLSRQSSALSSFNLTRTPSSTLLPTHPPHQPLPKFLHRTLTNRLLHRTHTPRPKTFDDFVQEVKFIKFPNQTFFLFDWLRPRRRLCPDRRPGSAVSHVGRDGECRLLVQVSRAYNIPVRKDVRGKTVSFEPTLMSSSPPLGEGVDPSHYVRPFVEVTFQQQRVRTSASEGPDPYWNETLALHIPLASETDLDTDVIHFNVFDEVVVDVQKPGLSNEEYTYQRRERNWIGAVTVPFATVHEQKRVAGEFLLKLPLASLGYEYPVPSPSNTLSGDRTTSSEREDRKCPNTILHMFIALDPALPLPAEIPFQTTSTEPAPLLRHATHFLASLPHPYHNTTNTHPREITLTTSTLSGQTTFTTRFIRPQKPPPTLPHTLPSLLRYVSLIPYLASRTLYAASSHRIWATTDQFLSIGAGDLAEHAVLLCNYLKYAGVKAWVVLGRDVPRGRTAWVLVCDEEGWKVCNPVEGDVFDVGDRWCPLVEVGCVFDETNVWANLQQYADPARITFDFDNTRHWKPFVSRGMRVPELTSVQIEEPLYHPIDNERLQELEAYLEESVVDAVEDWRGTQMTRWNRLVSRTFAGLLPTFESSLCTPNPTAPIPDLSRIRTVYKLKGSPLSVPYTDASAVISAVNATNVHASVDEDVEFACAVWCSAYPGNVIGVWVWVAALTRGR